MILYIYDALALQLILDSFRTIGFIIRPPDASISTSRLRSRIRVADMKFEDDQVKNLRLRNRAFRFQAVCRLAQPRHVISRPVTNAASREVVAISFYHAISTQPL